MGKLIITSYLVQSRNRNKASYASGFVVFLAHNPLLLNNMRAGLKTRSKLRPKLRVPSEASPQMAFFEHVG